jgi:DNA-binding MarR family transcriptional regulator
VRHILATLDVTPARALPPAHRLVLLLLTLPWHPSVADLARWAGMSPTRCSGVLRGLEGAGWITRTAQRHPDGRTARNRYEVHPGGRPVARERRGAWPPRSTGA